MPAASTVDVVDDTGRLGPDAIGRVTAWVNHAAGLAVGTSGPGAGEVRVRIVDDAAMADAHARYSGVEGTTDVLTFDLTEGASERGAALDVDILVCLDEAARVAGSRTPGSTRAIEHELVLYILHGVLHCLGHDDHDDARFDAMHAEEDRILTLIGIGPVFATRDGGAA
jgi:probable rRNA maturation factor